MIAQSVNYVTLDNYADPTGAMTLNNGWIICIIVYLVIVCIGIGVEVIARKKRKA